MFQLAEALAERSLPVPLLQELEKQALTNRPDLKRIASEESAQQQSVAMAKSSFGPRVNAFAGWEMDNPTFVAGGGGNNWLGGHGSAIRSSFRAAQNGRNSPASELWRKKRVAMKQAATDAVRLEVRRAYYDVDASRQQVEVARAAIAEAQESLRINQDRYDSGLITITELLGAEEAARRSQTDYWEAVYRFHTSYAEPGVGQRNSESAISSGDAMNRTRSKLQSSSCWP